MYSFTANQAKTQFGEMMTKAQREPVSITKNGKPSVVVISVDDYQAYEKIKLEQLRSKLSASTTQAHNGLLHDGEAVFNELMKDL